MSLTMDIEKFKKTQKQYVADQIKWNNEIWPAQQSEVTYERILRFFIGSGNRTLAAIDALDVWSNTETTDEEKVLYVTRLHELQGYHNTALLLQRLHAIDSNVAEQVALTIWHAAEAGDGYGEDLWVWAIENDVPATPVSLGGKTQEQAKAEHYEFIERQTRREQNAEYVADVLSSLDEMNNDGVEPNALAEMITAKSRISIKNAKEGLNHLYGYGFIESATDDNKSPVRFTTDKTFSEFKKGLQ